jgi:indole-3-glycerol phosphate synthase
MGSGEYLSEIKKHVSVPLLRKDFILDEYQIFESAALGADAVLLICALLNTATLKTFIQTADALGLSCLVEAHSEAELSSALAAGARVVGVNNRDLRTFTVDLSNSLRLRPLVPSSVVFVSESGIKTPADIASLRQAGADAVLIGETLMISKNKKEALDHLRGPNK